MHRHGHGSPVSGGGSSSSTFTEDDEQLPDNSEGRLSEVPLESKDDAKAAPAPGMLGRMAGAAGGLAGGLWSVTSGTLSAGAQGARWVAGSGMAAGSAVAGRLPLVNRVVGSGSAGAIGASKDKNE